jgi:hypothetical protein
LQGLRLHGKPDRQISKLTEVAAITDDATVGNYGTDGKDGYNSSTKAVKMQWHLDSTSYTKYATDTTVCLCRKRHLLRRNLYSRFSLERQGDEGRVASISGTTSIRWLPSSLQDNSANNTTDKVKVVLVQTDGTVSSAASANKDIIGFLASNVSVGKVGEKYVASASIAALGEACRRPMNLPAKEFRVRSDRRNLLQPPRAECSNSIIDANGKVSNTSTATTNYGGNRYQILRQQRCFRFRQ